jgi:hypothetical protein
MSSILRQPWRRPTSGRSPSTSRRQMIWPTLFRIAWHCRCCAHFRGAFAFSRRGRRAVRRLRAADRRRRREHAGRCAHPSPAGAIWTAHPDGVWPVTLTSPRFLCHSCAPRNPRRVGKGGSRAVGSGEPKSVLICSFVRTGRSAKCGLSLSNGRGRGITTLVAHIKTAGPQQGFVRLGGARPVSCVLIRGRARRRLPPGPEDRPAAAGSCRRRRPTTWTNA